MKIKNCINKMIVSSLGLIQGRKKLKLNPLAQQASKFKFSLVPAGILSAEVMASIEIREQMFFLALIFN